MAGPVSRRVLLSMAAAVAAVATIAIAPVDAGAVGYAAKALPPEQLAIHHRCQHDGFSTWPEPAADAVQAAAENRHEVTVLQHVQWHQDAGNADVAAYLLNRLHWAERSKHQFHVHDSVPHGKRPVVDGGGGGHSAPGLPARLLLKALEHAGSLGKNRNASRNVRWIAFMGSGTWVDPERPVDLRGLLASPAMADKHAIVVSDPSRDTGVILVRASSDAVAVVEQWVATGNYPPVDAGLPAQLYFLGRPDLSSAAGVSAAVMFGARYGACLAGQQDPEADAAPKWGSSESIVDGARAASGSSSSAAATAGEQPLGQFGVPEGDWFDELIPPSLRAKYRRLAKYGYGQYALRRSRPVVGATDRMVQFWQKVIDKQCVKIVVLGASVSVGVNIGGVEEAWHAEFIRWLNAKYPCADGGNHTSVLSGVVGGCDSGSFLDHVDMFDAEDEIDLVFVEFGANDPLMTQRNSQTSAGRASRLDDPDNRLGTGVEALEFATELIVRRVLELRRPGPVALVYVEVSWYYHQWLKLIEGEVLAAELYKTEYAGMGAWGHYNMLSYYGVPQVSATDFAQLTWEHPNRTDLTVEFKDRPGVFQTDGCCHPRDWVHIFASMALAHNFETEYALSRVLSERGPRYSEDRSMFDPPILKAPWRMTPKEVDKYTHATVTSINFMKRPPAMAEIGVVEGWQHMADSKSKTGMIATKVGSHVSFKLGPAVHETLLVGYLTSYEKITPVKLWVDQSAAGDCGNKGATIDPWHDGWIGKVSVYRSYVAKAPLAGGYVHFCLSPDNKGRFDDKAEGKFKLLSLTYM